MPLNHDVILLRLVGLYFALHLEWNNFKIGRRIFLAVVGLIKGGRLSACQLFKVGLGVSDRSDGWAASLFIGERGMGSDKKNFRGA